VRRLAEAAEAAEDAPLVVDHDERGCRKLIHCNHFRILLAGGQRVFAESGSFSQANETCLTDKQTSRYIPCSVLYFIDPDGGSRQGRG
jgi:hypothetical protein